MRVGPQGHALSPSEESGARHSRASAPGSGLRPPPLLCESVLAPAESCQSGGASMRVGRRLSFCGQRVCGRSSIRERGFFLCQSHSAGPTAEHRKFERRLASSCLRPTAASVCVQEGALACILLGRGTALARFLFPRVSDGLMAPVPKPAGQRRRPNRAPEPVRLPAERREVATSSAGEDESRWLRVVSD